MLSWASLKRIEANYQASTRRAAIHRRLEYAVEHYIT
jgi:hypothetical protein